MSGTDTACSGELPFIVNVAVHLEQGSTPAIVLRAPYTLSGTGAGCGKASGRWTMIEKRTRIRWVASRYRLVPTPLYQQLLSYGPVRLCPVLARAVRAVLSYAGSGTDYGYDATRRTGSTCRGTGKTRLPSWYSPLGSYAGATLCAATEIAYAPTRSRQKRSITSSLLA
eukprot:2212587-Rhodomonas_salina.1